MSKFKCGSSAGTAIYSACRFVKEELSFAEVMGYTGHAFRININANDVDVAGPTGYDWEDFFQKGLKNLGFHCKTVRTENFTPPTAEELTRALSLIQASLDKGVPAIGWDLFTPEFGNIYGYDDEKKELMANDPRGEGALPYEKLGRGQANELFVMTIEETFAIDQKTMLKGALELAVHHANVREHLHDIPPYQNGLKGYDAWIQAFQNRNVSDFGNAYNAGVVHDARQWAAKFFEGISLSWNDDKDENKIARLAKAASEDYTEIANQLGRLVDMFPFPDGGDPNAPEQAYTAIEILNKAKQAEVRAVKTLEEMLCSLG
ncbi:hypothetical protein ACFO4N_11865 [Camelliibacillus cellulosilyticus]|uniref:Uncharacterized protein n=1 Tax=Camelliibacillus cellulosilyticus TaxID=2174486 RepID=A0ABV9GQA9_9BACL